MWNNKNIYLKDLNAEQQKAIKTVNKPVAIMAGAGSGKTRTIINKIIYLIQNQKIDPQKILAMTFTNKAALEMKHRLIDKMEELKNVDLQICTFHALGAQILKHESKNMNLPYDFNILDNGDQKIILKTIYRKYNMTAQNWTYNSMITYISNKKILEILPENLIQNSKNENEKIKNKIFRDYQQEIKKIQALDFDDLIIKTKNLLKDNENIRQKWANKFDYILLDEFQDTSKAQYEMIQYILKNKNNITVVGDPDQNIYSWRGADMNLILNFNKEFDNSKIIKLEQNYRSTKNILNLANTLIQKNQNRISKNLFSSREEGAKIEYYKAYSQELETKWIVSKVNELKKQKNKLENIVILYRANYISAAIEKELIKQNINYIIYGGIKFYKRKEIKDVIAYLKIINNGDEIALRRMINIPSKKIGDITLNKIINFANKKNMNSYQVIMKHINDLQINDSVKIEIAKFINSVNKYKKALENNPLDLVLKKFLEEVNYYTILSADFDNQRIDNIKEFINTIKEWTIKNKNKNLSDYLDEIALYSDLNDTNPINNFISLMTVHKSKGLEFKNVFIMGFCEEIFPSQRAIDEGGAEALEEERRLAYVAITRAKDNLFISTSNHNVSRFLKDMNLENKNVFNNQNDYLKEKEKNILKHGDKINHFKFGNGVVTNIQNDLIDINFAKPFGTKTFVKNNKVLEKIN